MTFILTYPFTFALFRILCVAFGFSFKMISEIDMMSLNEPLSQIIGLSVKHFYQIECSIYRAMDFDIGISEEDFNEKVKKLNMHCHRVYSAELAR